MDSKNIKTISQANVPFSHAGYLRCAGACNNLTFQGGFKKKKPKRKLLLQKALECGECTYIRSQTHPGSSTGFGWTRRYLLWTLCQDINSCWINYLWLWCQSSKTRSKEIYFKVKSSGLKKKILHCLTGLPCHLLPLNFFPQKSSQKTEPLKLCFLPPSVFFEVLSVAEANALAVSALFSEDGLHRGNP